MKENEDTQDHTVVTSIRILNNINQTINDYLLEKRHSTFNGVHKKQPIGKLN